jgi:hypothetical protein
MQIADVKHQRLARDARVRRELGPDAERHDVDTGGIDAECRHDLVPGERGVGQDPVRGASAGAIERPADRIGVMRVPLGDTGVADVMEGDDQRPHAPERCPVGGRVKHVVWEPSDRQRQCGEVPPQVGRQQCVRVDPTDTGRKDDVPVGPDSRDACVWLHATDCLEQLTRVTPHAASGRGQRSSVEGDSHAR